MYPKDKKTAALMSETIREVLSDKGVMKAIIKNSEKKPPYWDMLPEKNGVTAIVIAQMLKAMAGDTAAFTALSKYGFGEKVQMDVSDFYRTNSIKISVVEPKTLDADNNSMLDNGGIVDGVIEGGSIEDGEANDELGETVDAELVSDD